MKQCLMDLAKGNTQLEVLLSVGYVLLLFCVAFAFLFLVYYILKRTLPIDSLAAHLTKGIKRPLFVMIFAIFSMVAIDLLNIQHSYAKTLKHVAAIVLIISVGWILFNVAKQTYRYILAYYTIKKQDLARQAALTQIQILYRVISFGIVVLTGSTILMTFPTIRSLGVGILSSAGIAGIALGIAARPILLNFMAGFQIALTKKIKIGDMIEINGLAGRVEHLFLTTVVIKLFDLKRYVVPISAFIDQPFQNWSPTSTALMASFFLYCDYSVPVDKVRKKFGEILHSLPEWNREKWKLEVTDLREQTVQLRFQMSVNDATESTDLSAHMREEMIDFLQNTYPHVLPHMRVDLMSAPNLPIVHLPAQEKRDFEA